MIIHKPGVYTCKIFEEPFLVEGIVYGGVRVDISSHKAYLLKQEEAEKLVKEYSEQMLRKPKA